MRFADSIRDGSHDDRIIGYPLYERNREFGLQYLDTFNWREEGEGGGTMEFDIEKRKKQIPVCSRCMGPVVRLT
jgi:hypothetical protein